MNFCKKYGVGHANNKTCPDCEREIIHNQDRELNEERALLLNYYRGLKLRQPTTGASFTENGYWLGKTIQPSKMGEGGRLLIWILGDWKESCEPGEWVAA